MKVAIFGESAADEAAARIIINAILGPATEPVSLRGLRGRGWGSILRTLPVIIRQLHYHGDADGLVIVVDSDDTPVHQPSHDPLKAQQSDCRLCRIRCAVESVRSTLRPAIHRVPLRIAVGIATPAIEAWLLAGRDVHVTEAAWTRAMLDRRYPFTRATLKQMLYGVAQASIGVELDRMTNAAKELVADMDTLRRNFPVGFGSLESDLRTW